MIQSLNFAKLLQMRALFWPYTARSLLMVHYIAPLSLLTAQAKRRRGIACILTALLLAPVAIGDKGFPFAGV
ncbi:hypothetical protein HF673_05200 [Acidithiobacillus thiooxidans]|uniref:Uncharacterized protein n=1 Tax=Acidithiobacillus thiooxidans ATCC 19377 TaxID=637390 RepID=A0A5P9XVC0_ACITH|nr:MULTISPECIES: hypothetical protein [Acidithiobacillus]MBU2835196.1 hypothetical protein [Acidithiobacillus thiooxidans]MDA8177454.1 hypothetical protein [Acidithiobacillus sp.]QFX97176.1 hypothetical protein GCD22_03062 [Acidithiobacillus thiooxidans ATCC 19377]